MSRAEFDVAVIGGGVAGLAAASAVAEAGRTVVVLEARGALGGRATAFRDRETGELVDNGQHVLFGCYDETFRFLRRVGAEANVRVQPALEVPYLDLEGRRSVLRCPRWPAPLHLLGGARGEWAGDNEFQLDLNFIANINHYDLRLRFVGDELEVTANEASGLSRNGKLVGTRVR